MKFLLWAAIALAIVVWLMHGKKSLKQPESSGHRPAPQARPGDGEQIVACAHCGVHVPISESIAGPNGAAFCSEEHRRLHV